MMKYLAIAGLAALLTTVVVPAPTHAQDEAEAAPAEGPAPDDDGLRVPAPNQGHYVALGLYLGAGMADDNGRGTRGPGFGGGFSLRLGESITDWADVGIAFAMAFTEDEQSLTLGRLTVQSQLYVTERWFVHGGFGFGGGGGPDPHDTDYSRGRYGDVYVTGAGVNLYLTDSHSSGGWLVTPRMTFELGPDKEFTTLALMFGAEISWWSGLRKDRLDLSFDKAYEKASEGE